MFEKPLGNDGGQLTDAGRYGLASNRSLGFVCAAALEVATAALMCGCSDGGGLFVGLVFLDLIRGHTILV